MNKAAALAKKFGDNINQSIGVREPTNSDERKEPQDILPLADPDAGRTRLREAGHMEIDNIIPDPDQVRKEFREESIAELASSLKRFGQLQPIRVVWRKDLGKWVIRTGERRWRAAKFAGLQTMSCIFVTDESDKSQTLQEQLTENCLRENLRPMEQAEAFHSLMELNGWNASQLAEALSISNGKISKALSLLKLPQEVQDKVASGDISGSAAYQVAKLKDETEQRELVTKIESEGLSRDDTAKAVTAKTKPADADKPKRGRPVTTKVFKLESCKITMTFNRKRVTKNDLQRAYEELGEAIKAA